MVIDTRPLILAVATDANAGCEPRIIARRFHSTVVRIIQEMCVRIGAATGIGTVVLSGGVFMNSLLSAESQRKLGEAGFRVYRHRKVPANDGGLSLGQLAIAAQRS
jgi:hydrogenase maturation protein HypF